jgi:hypothetical protein
MRLDGERESSNVDDRRGLSTGGGVAIGGGRECIGLKKDSIPVI